MVKCKFVCTSVTKRMHWDKTKGFLFEAEFTAVTDGSKENEEFFEATPSGSLKIGTYKSDHFEPGREYVLDITKAL